MTILDGSNSVYVIGLSGVIDVYLRGFSITRGYATSGAGMRVVDGVNATVEDCTFYDNYATYDGGAFYVRGPVTSLHLNNCVCVDNRADHNSGAGLVIQGGSLSITSCVFLRNTTDTYAGAVCTHNSVLDVSNSLFRENTSGEVAGAIYVYDAIGGGITNCTFYGNGAPRTIAGTIVINLTSTVSVTDNVITGEQSRYGLYYHQCIGSHGCNVFWDNNDGSIFGDALDATDVEDDPLFCSPLTGEFTISAASPAAPANNLCAVLIGAYPIGCSGPVVTKPATWGQIKKIYSE